MKFPMAASLALLGSVLASAQINKKTQDDHPTSLLNCETIRFDKVEEILTAKSGKDKTAALVIAFALEDVNEEISMVVHLAGHSLALFSEDTLSKYKKHRATSRTTFIRCAP